MKGRSRRSLHLVGRLSERVFRALLLAYPEPFRAEFGEPMSQTFRDQLRAAQTAGGIIALWARTLRDVVSSALQERMDEMRGRETLLMGAIALGMVIAWVDSRPGWDDTGVTVGTLVLICAALGAASPKQAWQWALAVGLWIPLYGVLWSHNYGSVIALIPAFLGAYFGAGLRSFAAAPPGRA